MPAPFLTFKLLATTVPVLGNVPFTTFSVESIAGVGVAVGLGVAVGDGVDESNRCVKTFICC